MKPRDPYVSPWKDLHDRGYFANHPHYLGWKLDAAGFVDSLRSLVGLFAEDDVLDIGCGYGRVMHAVAPHVRAITGVDVHAGPLIKAEEILARMPNCFVRVCDGRTLPFPDGSFSLVYSTSVMQHVPDEIARGYVLESARVLRVGGRMMLLFSGGYEAGEIKPEVVHEQSQPRTEDQVMALARGACCRFRAEVFGPGPYTVTLIGERVEE